MTRLSNLTVADFKKKIKKAGFEYYRDAAGSHEIWWQPETGRRVVIAVHSRKTIKKGTLSKMLRNAGLSVEEFTRL